MSAEANAPSAVSTRLQAGPRYVLTLCLYTLLPWGIDWLSAHPRVPWDTLWIRAGWWAVSMASVLIWIQPWLDSRQREWLRLGTVLVVPNLAIAAVVWRLGGVQSPLFAWFCAMPVVSVLMATGNIRAAVVGAATSWVSALGVLLLSGQPLLAVAVWGLLVALAGLMAIQATHFYAQLQRARAQEEVNRRQAQEMLAATHRRAVEADQLAQVGRLVAGVAHEVNNPLAFIQANLHFLQEQLPRQGTSIEEFVEVVRETQEGVVRIQQIVRDLTGLARGSLELGSGDLSACQLHILIVESMRLASLRLRKLAMVVEVPPEVPLVQADARRLVQVLLNLLLNAADALEETRVAAPRVVLQVSTTPEWVRVVVEDNGPGFSPEHLAQLFTPFFTTKAQGKGTGLGLAVSRQYMESFGGLLSAENQPSGGARFILSLRPA
ncbi:ATP-binding protein [Stigmatella sp. ncwal1]|uniref:histidine kinase n=1 Tax=Stigmatella ashevillensis TaxID=2995309 RepID=A0ABT5DC76_9BACT|nr:ATP-binding protein [Stigmatella ashevillena]MDC0711236.1 ATP-binding protein [Stigmatella ashevillena]